MFRFTMSLAYASRDTYCKILNGCIRAFEPNKNNATSNLSLNKFLSLAIDIAGNPVLSKVHKFYSTLHSFEGSQIQIFLSRIGDNNIQSGLRILEKDFSIARNPQSELIQALTCFKLGINTLLATAETKAKRSTGLLESFARVYVPETGKDEMIGLYNKAYHTSTLVAFLYLFSGEIEISNRIYQQAILFFYYELLYKSTEYLEFQKYDPRPEGLLDAKGRKWLIGKELVFTHSIFSGSLNDPLDIQIVGNFYEERRKEEKEFLDLSRDIFNINLEATLGVAKKVLITHKTPRS